MLETGNILFSETKRFEVDDTVFAGRLSAFDIFAQECFNAGFKKIQSDNYQIRFLKKNNIVFIGVHKRKSLITSAKKMNIRMKYRLNYLASYFFEIYPNIDLKKDSAKAHKFNDFKKEIKCRRKQKQLDFLEYLWDHSKPRTALVV